MKKSTAIFAVILLLSSLNLTKGQDIPNTEYMIIVTDIGHSELLEKSKIYISINGKKYLEKKISKKATEGKYDFNPLISLIREYNRKGWKMVSSNFSSSPDESNGNELLYIVMTRKSRASIDMIPIDTILNKRDSVLLE